jgi:hypothetical protein
MTASTEDRAGDARAIRERQPTPTMPIAFGPVRSRRLGWSLGINNVPPKTCSYSCVYCQVGATDHARLERLCFFPPDEVVAAVRRRVVECTASRQPVDIATFVPDGESTLDVNLGAAIRGVAGLGLRIVVQRATVHRIGLGGEWRWIRRVGCLSFTGSGEVRSRTTRGSRRRRRGMALSPAQRYPSPSCA